MLKDKDLARFLSKIEKTETCWLWNGRLSINGYGQFDLNRYPVQAHRLSYEIFVGPIPDDLRACHRCDVRNCVRPDHLFLGTDSDNLQDAARKGRLWQTRKDCCPYGHLYSDTNIYTRPSRPNSRECRICREEKKRRRRAEGLGQSA